MISKIRNILLDSGNKREFVRICNTNKITLNYKLNKNEFGILSDIFENREYSDYFPFYKKSTIIDIGAHYGYFSIFASKNTSSQSTILAIEPGINNFKQMTNNIIDNKIENVIAINCAVGGKNELSTLYLGKSSNNSLISDNFLLVSDNFVEKIESKTLEKIIIENKIEKIDFLKMDCEGSEFSILGNLSKETFDKITTLSMEFHDLKNEKYTGDNLIKILIDNDFVIVKYQYSKTMMGLNYGKIIGTRSF